MVSEKKLDRWGESVWEAKIKLQDETGVIHGGRHNKKGVIKQKNEIFMYVEKEIIPLLKKGSRIMDAGVGPMARYSIEFAKKGFEVVGVDVSPTTLEVAKKHVKNSGVEKVTFVKDDLTTLGNVKGKFDLVFCFGTFGHIPKILAIDALRGFNRSLNKGGLCFIHFWFDKKKTIFELAKDFLYKIVHKIRVGSGKSFDVNCSFYSLDELKELISKSGFEVTKRKGDLFLLKKIN